MKAVVKAIEALSKLPVYWTVNGKYYKGLYNAVKSGPYNKTYNAVQISKEEYLEATKESLSIKDAARGLIRAALVGK